MYIPYRIAFTLQEIDMGLYNTFVKAKTMKNALYNPSIYEGVYYPITEHRNYIYSNEERTAKFKQYIHQNGYKDEGAYFLEYLQKLTDIEFTLAKEFFNKESASSSTNYTGLDDSLNSFFLDEEFKRFLDNYFRENEWYVLPF